MGLPIVDRNAPQDIANVAPIASVCEQGCEGVMLYGLGQEYRLHALRDTLSKRGFAIYAHDAVPEDFPSLLRPHNREGSRYKHVLSNLIVYNYKRHLADLPIVPLIFLIEFGGILNLRTDYKRLADSSDRKAYGRHGNYRSSTDTEIRRCYKIYNESTGLLKEVAKRTFHFFSVTQSKIDQDMHYTYKEIAPIWENRDFVETFNKHRDSVQGDRPRYEGTWREYTDKAINELNFFSYRNPESVPDDGASKKRARC